MNSMLPVHVTVAAVIERNGRYLMVEEKSELGETVYNQPAGHLETGESLIQAIVREVREETGLDFEPTGLVGTYLLNPAANGRHYLRFCFSGNIDHEQRLAPEDSDIIAAHWLSLDQILARQDQLRSGLTLKSLLEYREGKFHSLATLDFDHDEQRLHTHCVRQLAQPQSTR